jgi:hypothetical protein
MLFLLIISVLFSSSFIQAIPSISFFYPKNLTVSTCTGDLSWTKWFNSAKPRNENDFDLESVLIIQRENGHDMCEIPQGIQAQSVTPLTSGVNYATSWRTADGIIFEFVSRTAGVDFQVRFCCPNNEFVTTTPRPIDSQTCGRAQIKPSLQVQRIFGGSRAVPHSWPWVSLFL